jgi:DNA-binding response OmpR family regulator
VDVSSAVVAVIDDEESLRASVGTALAREGMQVRLYRDGRQAWAGLCESEPDVVVLDIVMPGLDGLELCRRLRARSAQLPILFLTSRDEEFDRVLGLEIGADDYLCKPFSMRELVARIRVLLRRARLGAAGAEKSEDILDRGLLRLDLLRYTASWRGREIGLTVTEFRILQSLVENPGVVKTRAQLMNAAFPHDNFVSERTVDTHIKRIRRKIETVDQEFSAIGTVYGLGYRYGP